MYECCTEAIVLDKEDLGEADARVFLFTKSLGKVVAKVKSAKKITSKLSSHLEPLNLITVRLVEKNGFQVVDVLSNRKLPQSELHILNMVNQLSAENQQDLELWSVLTGSIDLRPVDFQKQILSALGFDPKFASCQNCDRPRPDYFSLLDTSYLCQICALKSGVRQNCFKLN
ncbi:MAG: DNA repair protein RecO [Candidatus Harrisonbacteria bacterium RIFCSPHIGHO2_01_FULL_44_13]|uniref:DNA repair protein RecO n=1 Tax=Candidatus Harrisonbacteria bacterium RIFCSPLOWO2_01_FULL_44_18 TaxID=1798407 RepID=A0A1G1ZL28_9BACT|nr:MAG: DNA repair protein RecO [Candidatus Harrisonbacteria bacterium RIFCSPHIGHO2_01_FULL_44_13]OGY65149.1 MAG: DNA repair protein RecO [Candidatus Harrisonbacteria bacterium RIFCSPLOWO2_01_FULL_44_18]